MNLLTAFLIFTLIAWLATPFDGLAVLGGPARLARGDGRAPAGRRDPRGQRQSSTSSSATRMSSTDLQEHVGKPVTLTVQRANGTLDRHGHAPHADRDRRLAAGTRPAGRRRARSASAAATRASAGVLRHLQPRPADRDRDRGAADRPLVRADPRRARRPRRRVREQPDGRRRRSPARSASRPRSATSSSVPGRS